MVNGMKIGAVILAAGKGTRMGENISKQHIKLAGRPLISWALEAFEKSEADDIILVVGEEEEDYVNKEILPPLALTKIRCVTKGGKERYNSTYEGLKALGACDIVLVHDGVRPLIDQDVISRVIRGTIEYGACVAAVPVKDTIRVVDDERIGISTPNRSNLWQIQTPQGFSYTLLRDAYEKLMKDPILQEGVTDDAMVVERTSEQKVKLTKGSYENIKVTVPEDLVEAEAFLKRREGEMT